MWWIECIRCEKSRRDFTARTFALVTLVHPVLHRVSCSYETITNAPKHYETHQNMSLGSNGVDQVLWLRKITTRLRGTNFCINCTSSVCFATSSCSYEKIPNAPKYYETHQNISLGCNGADWVHSLRRILMWLRGTNFSLIAPVHPVLHRVSCSYETITNAPKHYETHQNKSLGSNGVDQVLWLRKITTRHRGTKFCINCTSLVCFPTSFMQLRNDPKCTEILQNGLKY